MNYSGETCVSFKPFPLIDLQNIWVGIGTAEYNIGEQRRVVPSIGKNILLNNTYIFSFNRKYARHFWSSLEITFPLLDSDFHCQFWR